MIIDMAPIFTPTLEKGLREINRNPSGKSLIVVTIPECDSCHALKDDIDLISRRTMIENIIVATLDLSSDSEMPSMSQLQLTDVPAVYLFIDGVVKAGWSGYDYDHSQEQRVEVLCDNIIRKSETLEMASC